ncbi:MAG: hypothetical protein Q9172_007181 [Xanthocarpia lactea]
MHTFTFFGAVLVAGTLLWPSSAQVTTECDPTKGVYHPSPPMTCPNNQGLTTDTYSIDFTTTKTLPSEWQLANYSNVTLGDQGAEFTFAKRYDAPTMWTKFKFFFGRAEFVVKAAPGVGIISSMVLLSDDLDEIDWEFLGGVNTSVQTNYFGKGYTGTYNRSTSPAVASPQTQFHTYALDWSTAALTWSIDGVVVRTLNAVDADGNGSQYPQSPMKVSLGLWDAGDPDAPTKEWAGGVTPIPPPEPYTMYVKSVKIFNQNPAQQYQYTDRSGSWQSIKVINDVPFSSSSSLASTQGTTLSLGFTSAVSSSQMSQTSAGMSSLSSNSTALASAASMQLSSSSLSGSSQSTVAASRSRYSYIHIHITIIRGRRQQYNVGTGIFIRINSSHNTAPRESSALGSSQTPVSTIPIPLTPNLQSQIASSSSSPTTAFPLDSKSVISLGTLTAWGFSTFPDITTTSIDTDTVSSTATASRHQLTLPAAPAFDTEEDDDWEEDYETDGMLSIHPAASSHISDDPLASEEDPIINEKASSLVSPISNDDSPASTTDDEPIDFSDEDEDGDIEPQTPSSSDAPNWDEDIADDETEASNDDDVYDDEEEWDTPPPPFPSPSTSKTQKLGSPPQPPYARPNGTVFQGKPSIAYATPSGVAGATATTMPFKGGAGGKNGMRLGAWCVSGLGVVLGIMVVGL